MCGKYIGVIGLVVISLLLSACGARDPQQRYINEHSKEIDAAFEMIKTGRVASAKLAIAQAQAGEVTKEDVIVSYAKLLAEQDLDLLRAFWCGAPKDLERKSASSYLKQNADCNGKDAQRVERLSDMLALALTAEAQIKAIIPALMAGKRTAAEGVEYEQHVLLPLQKLIGIWKEAFGTK